jgi:hypothetical protein
VHTRPETAAGLFSVLVLRDFFKPVDDFAAELFLNGDVGHSGGGRGAVPMLFAGREPDDVTGADFFNGSGLALGPAAASGDDERLTERMRVPRSSRAGFEGYAGALDPSRIGRLKERVNADRAREPIGRAFRGCLRASSFDFHFLISPFEWGRLQARHFLQALWIPGAFHLDS